MKRFLLAICGGALLLTGCKETNIPITALAKNAIAPQDTTYVVSPVPAAQPHNVLMEEFTGQACSNCPQAHEILLSLAAANPGRLNIIGLYIPGIPQSVPPAGSRHDFESDTAKQIADGIFGSVNQLPGGSIDRTPVDGALQLGRDTWSGIISNRLSLPDSVNVVVQSTYDAGSNTDTIKVTATYTQQVTSAQNLSVVITEDSIVDIQEIPPTPGGSGYDDNYVFTSVFREMLTSVPGGDALLPGMTMKEAGRVAQRIYIFKPDSAWVLAHCKVIAFVNSTTTGDLHVLQSAQCALKQ